MAWTDREDECDIFAWKADWEDISGEDGRFERQNAGRDQCGELSNCDWCDQSRIVCWMNLIKPEFI